MEQSDSEKSFNFVMYRVLSLMTIQLSSGSARSVYGLIRGATLTS